MVLGWQTEILPECYGDEISDTDSEKPKWDRRRNNVLKQSFKIKPIYRRVVEAEITWLGYIYRIN